MTTRPVVVRDIWPKTVQLGGLLKKLSVQLSKTVHSCESFLSENADIFKDISPVANNWSPVPVIRITLRELKLSEKRLLALAENCDDINRNVSPPVLDRLVIACFRTLLLTHCYSPASS